MPIPCRSMKLYEVVFWGPLRVVTAGRNLQLLAEPQDGMLVFHRVDPFIPFEDGSERMPNVFFKMATCSRA